MKKQILHKNILRFGALFFIGLFVASIFFAAPIQATTSTSTDDLDSEQGVKGIDLTLDDVVAILQRVARYFYSVAIVLAIILTIYIGVLFFAAGGGDAQIGKAKTALIWLIVGVAVLLIGRGIIAFVRSILEVPEEASINSSSIIAFIRSILEVSGS